jgi:hypothetical protein
LLIDGQLDRCFVFENRRKIFPIDSRIKVALVVASRGGGPTEQFRAAFFVGKDAAGRERTVGLEELPDTLAELDRSAPILTLEQLQLLAPMTWSFPELRTALDAEIAAQAARALPPLNLDERGWGLRYCRELDADRDAWRFVREQDLPAGSERVGLRWHSPDGTEWWPAIQGEHFYDLEFPRDGHFPTTWVNGNDMGTIDARRNPDGTPVMKHYRVVWRDIARSVDERSAIAAILPPRVAAKDKAPTVWGGSIDAHRALALAAVMSSFPFDYLVRFKGAISLKYGILNQISAPPFDSVAALVPLVAEVVCEGDEYAALWNEVCPGVPRPRLSAWDRAERRARIDAEVVLAYGFDLSQYAALLSTFPNLDRSQPMLPGEPKSFVTRDLALLAYAQRTAVEPLDIHALLESVGVNLPPPRPEFRRLDARVERYREIGAVPYRPTPRGARTPDDPELVDGVRELLAAEAQTAAALAEALDEDERIVKAIAERLTDTDALVYAEGRGANRRYYVIEGE